MSPTAQTENDQSWHFLRANCIQNLILLILLGDDSKALVEIYRLVFVSMRYDLSFKSYPPGKKA